MPSAARFDFGAVARWMHRLGQVELRLGQPDVLDRVSGGVGDEQRHRVGHPDVLGGEDHQAAGDEAGVLPRLEHAGEPVQARRRRRIRGC